MKIRKDFDAFMDDKTLEKMIIRSARSISSPSMIILAALALCCSSIIFAIMHKSMLSIVGSFHLSLFFVSATLAFLPLSIVIPIISCRYFRVRMDGEEQPLFDISMQKLRLIVLSCLYAAGVCAIQIGFVVFSAIWCGFESVPILGKIVYFFFSWVPAIITLVMGVFFLLSIFLLFSANARLSQDIEIEGSLDFFKNMAIKICTQRWIRRVKIMLCGCIPLGIFYIFSRSWGVQDLPITVEIGAFFVRTVVFSVLASPLFLFAVHMSVEADRFVGIES